jgi:hypothetical protein|tara:strand:- start:650 stop:1150 length:501 start_codon:yes stop_codon:yes gene_type:complete
MPYIDEQTKYQFVKFKDGKEIFAMVRDAESKLELHFPMNIQLQPAITGGVLLHLGPYIPFTKEDSITVDTNAVLFRTSISKKFISFYDEACSAWLNIREDESKFDIKSGRQAMKEQQEFMEGMIKRRFEEGDIDFRDEIDDMLDNIEEEQKLLANESGPGKDDTIH